MTKETFSLEWSAPKKLMTSSLYRGCSSRSRGTQAGKTILRDALYWVPLIMMTMGTRFTEVL